MGASILWKPVRPEGKSLGFGGRSSAIEAFRRAFGEEPWVFTGADVAKLEGINAALREDEAMNKLIDAINTHGTVEVWPQY